MDWNDYFINIAKSVALKSKDPATKYGAIVVSPENSIISTGYNSFPRNYPDDLILEGEGKHRLERPEKYYWFEHAERNAIYNAARHGIRLEGCRMYVTSGLPCVDCSRAIIQAGIIELYYDARAKLRHIWSEHAIRSEELFTECGVKLHGY